MNEYETRQFWEDKKPQVIGFAIDNNGNFHKITTETKWEPITETKSFTDYKVNP